MNKTNCLLLLILIVLSFVLGSTLTCKAQSKSFTGIMPFMTSTNRLVFFDQGNGKIYVYDDNFNQCLFIGQLQDLGQSISKIQ